MHNTSQTKKMIFSLIVSLQLDTFFIPNNKTN